MLMLANQSPIDQFLRRSAVSLFMRSLLGGATSTVLPHMPIRHFNSPNPFNNIKDTWSPQYGGSILN
jgi:hypothetical protein